MPLSVRAGKALGEQVRVGRMQAGLDVATFAKKMGRSPSWVVRIERNASSLTVKTLKRISEIQNLPMEFYFRPLVGRTE